MKIFLRLTTWAKRYVLAAKKFANHENQFLRYGTVLKCDLDRVSKLVQGLSAVEIK